MKLRILKKLALVAVASLSLGANAQTLTITNGVQKYASLASTTVNMSGRCELWVTNSTTPLSGCTINLNSIDAWLFLPNVKPSVVASTYLGQVRVIGATAVADSNVRVVQYGQNGTVIIPQASNFQPLTVFTGAGFSGTATAYSQWTYYTGASITNISSFKLKRGYQAVLAQSANGAMASKCYVAQDGDLEIGVLPTTLDQQVQFIYVTPWRWTCKKGVAGNPGLVQVNTSWWYDWNIDATSPRDWEYVAIRQQPYWPGLSQNWQSLGINTVLGYNEPDNSSQDAYKNLNPVGSVSDAVARLPDQLATGLRVGSPAITDAGRSGWLYPFVTQADAAGYRLDFVAIHYYWGWSASDPSGAANQMYNFLLNIWNNTHRPIWITEWNNGANWTDSSYAAPTYAQQQACIAAMTQMLENTPFVERYALYNWVEDVRALTTNGVVTAAGTTYSNLVSQIAYSQTMPDNGTRGIAQFLFNTNTLDTSGYYNNAMAVGAPAFTTGHSSSAQAIALDGANNYVQLPANIAKGNAFTFAAWVYWNGGGNWQRIFDFGNPATSQSGPSQYMFLTPSSGGTTLRFTINNGSGETVLERAGALASGSWQHIAVTLSNNVATLYVNGAQVASSASFTITPASFSPGKNYLGKSQFADPLFNGKLDEVEIADFAMSAAQIAALYNSTQSQPYAGGIWTNNASGNWGTSNNWNSGWIASGTGFMADFSTIDITGNRTVTLDSARTIGGLRFGDLAGAQTWLLSGANTLTLDAGGGNTPAIAVNQNTATISTPMSGTSGISKSGNGTLTLNGANTLGGGLTVNAGTVSISGGSTAFGSGTSTIGYLTGSGNLTMTGGSLAMGGELRVGGSDQNGSAYNAAGTVAMANATLAVGALTVARANYLDNSISGTLTLNSGGTLISTNDAILQFAGAGRGKLALNGGNFIVGPTGTRWLMVGFYDSGAGELDITNGTLFLENGTSLKLCRNGNTGGNVVSQIGGNVTFYSDDGVTVGGGGNLDLNYAGAATSTNTYNLNGGTLTVPTITASSGSGASLFNFNGGTLKPTAATATFLQGLTLANIRNSGAKIDTAGWNITINQALKHSAISGDLATDGGLTKNGVGKLIFGSTNTYTGNTGINAGTLVLGSVASIAGSKNIGMAAGASLDVSAVTGGFTLASSQTLYGTGAVNGMVTNNGTIQPGFPLGTMGAMTFSNPPVLNGVMLMNLDRNNGTPLCGQIIVPSGILAYGGTLTVNNIGGPLQARDTFQLFSAAGYGGAFAVTYLPSLNSGLAWSNSLAVNGSLAVVSTVSLVPTNILWSVSGTNLTLSWPQDHTGWRLLMQTNNLVNGISVNTNDWGTVPASQQTNQMILPIDPTMPFEFYRLIFP